MRREKDPVPTLSSFADRCDGDEERAGGHRLVVEVIDEIGIRHITVGIGAVITMGAEQEAFE